MGNATWAANTPSHSPIDSDAGYMIRGTLNLSSSYATGGDAVTAALFGIGTLEDLFCESSGGYVFRYNSTNATVQAYWGSASASAVLSEVTAGTNLAAVGVESMAFGY